MEFDDRDGLEPLGRVCEYVLDGFGHNPEQVLLEVLVTGQLPNLCLNMVEVILVLRDVDHSASGHCGW